MLLFRQNLNDLDVINDKLHERLTTNHKTSDAYVNKNSELQDFHGNFDQKHEQGFPTSVEDDLLQWNKTTPVVQRTIPERLDGEHSTGSELNCTRSQSLVGRTIVDSSETDDKDPRRGAQYPRLDIHDSYRGSYHDNQNSDAIEIIGDHSSDHNNDEISEHVSYLECHNREPKGDYRKNEAKENIGDNESYSCDNKSILNNLNYRKRQSNIDEERIRSHISYGNYNDVHADDDFSSHYDNLNDDSIVKIIDDAIYHNQDNDYSDPSSNCNVRVVNATPDLNDMIKDYSCAVGDIEDKDKRSHQADFLGTRSIEEHDFTNASQANLSSLTQEEIDQSDVGSAVNPGDESLDSFFDCMTLKQQIFDRDMKPADGVIESNGVVSRMNISKLRKIMLERTGKDELQNQAHANSAGSFIEASAVEGNDITKVANKGTDINVRKESSYPFMP